MLEAPVTYDAEARHECVPCQLAAQFSERYVRLAMLPLAAQPAVHCSTTRTISRVGFPGISDPPHRLRYVPMPASRRSLLLRGDVQVACWTRCPYGLRYVPVSGANVALQDGFDDPGAPQMISL